MDLAHPLGVAPGEVVVHRDEVDALAGHAVEVRRQRRHEGLALAGLRLGDPAEVQRGAAHELDVVVALADHPGGRLAHHRERFDEQVVDVGTVVEPLTELVGLRFECVVGQSLDLGTQRVDVRNDSFEGLDLLAFSSAEDAIEDSHAAIEPIGRVASRGGGAARTGAGAGRARDAVRPGSGHRGQAGAVAPTPAWTPPRRACTSDAPAAVERLRRVGHGRAGGDDVVDHEDSAGRARPGRARNTEPASRSRRVRPVCGHRCRRLDRAAGGTAHPAGRRCGVPGVRPGRSHARGGGRRWWAPR